MMVQVGAALRFRCGPHDGSGGEEEGAGKGEASFFKWRVPPGLNPNQPQPTLTDPN